MAGVTDGLVAFLRDCLDEDQAAALAVPWRHRKWESLRNVISGIEDSVVDALDGDVCEYAPMDGAAAHIARHDPAHVLAEVQAKRSIVDLCTAPAPAEARVGPIASMFLPATAARWAEPILKLLAAPYADRPGYQPEWGP